MEYSEMKNRVEADIAEARRRSQEILRSTNFVYRGKIKDDLPVKRGYRAPFWIASFEIDDSFTGMPIDKDQIYHACENITNRSSGFHLHYDFAFRCLTYTVRIGHEPTDTGSYIDLEAKQIVALLNSEAMKLVIETHLIHTAAMHALSDSMK